MKLAKVILVSITVGVLLDILIGATIPDRVMNVVFVVLASLAFLGVLFVAIGTTRKNRWGVNLKATICPACGSPMPQVREWEPRRQRPWWTCAKCGSETDKSGRLITPPRSG